VRASYDALSGEIHASARTALIDDSHFLRDAINGRLRAAPGVSGKAAWGVAFGARGDTDGDGNAARLRRSTSGFFLGADAPLSKAWRVGVVAGYSRTDADVDDRDSTADSDNVHLGAYGGAQWGAFALRLGASYTWHDIETRRTVAVSGLNDRLKASYDGQTAQVFGEAGYRIATPAAVFEPFAALAYVHLATDAFSETGGAAALEAGKDNTDVTFSTLGLRAESAPWRLGKATATARGSLGWRHAFGQTKPRAQLAFDSGQPFEVQGVPIAQDTALVEAGLDVGLTDAATLGVSYQGQLASDAREHVVKADFSYRF